MNTLRYILLALICAISINFISIEAIAAPTCPPSDPGKEKVEHNNSLLQYENWVKQQQDTAALGIPWDDCLSTGKIITNVQELNQTYIPSVITQDGYKIPDGGAATAVISSIGNFAGIGIATMVGAGIFGLIFAGIEVLIMMDACTNSYVLAPHEYMNKLAFAEKAKCEYVQQSSNGKNADCGRVRYSNADEMLNAEQVPFYYHCDPFWDPISDKKLSEGNIEDQKIIGRTYGYMGSASQYCIGNMRRYGDIAQEKKLVGKVVAQSAGGLIFRNVRGYGICDDNNRSGPTLIAPGEEQYVYPIATFAYYKFFSETGKIKICTASLRTILPVRLGCTTVAPPGDEDPIDPMLRAYVQGTRCAYLVGPRDDLHALGAALSETDEDGISRRSVKRFLQSEFHFTSTVVGCIKDMLVRIFVSKPEDTWNEKPFFQKVQERLKQIILAVLTLYVTLIGIKVITSPEPPKRPEIIMMVLKFALVFYFALGDAFYKTGPNGEVEGLYPQLISVTDELADMFMQAQNAGDYLGLCTYKYGNKNLLGENLYPGSGAIKTEGSRDGVKLTFWDLVDCKLINYLNAGSCDYTAGGLTMIWMVSVAFFVSGIGVLLALVSFIYCFMLLLVIFRYTHIYILSIIIVTVLLFLAPIFVCFALFEPTKAIFDKWMKVIFGYMIYPALLFAFLALMLATFDSIYYGDLKIDQTNINSQNGPVAQGLNLKTACEGVNSIYCTLMAPMMADANDSCDLSYGALSNTYVTKKSIPFTGIYATLSEDTANEVLMPVLKIMLFALLFYLFMDTVSQFMAALLSIMDVGGMARGQINLANIAGGAMSSSAGAASSGISALFGGGEKPGGGDPEKKDRT
ncbi:MAG: type IV secretion system protein [Alphaproteobacteria bacterium]|jgi:type IV secretion system protein VirB6|nr:type IV secretion system protein [Candidatus Jidaibacter sp.]